MLHGQVARLSSTTRLCSKRPLFSSCTRHALAVKHTLQNKLGQECRRAFTTSVILFQEEGSSASKPSTSSGTMFSDSEQSAWDHVFKDIKNMPPLASTAVRNPLRSQASRHARRQQMTARELSAFDDMFNMIFDAVAEQEPKSDTDKKSDVALSSRGHLGDLFGRLRRHSKRMKLTTQEDELLDKKKEQMELCNTDQDLLRWAVDEVFGESLRLEQASREAVAAAEAGQTVELPMLQSPIYSHLVAHLMQLFRDKFHDPHLALSIFDYARNLSIPSYVFGCSTQAYNELIKTRWVCFRDLRGVHDALQEMNVNAVDVNSVTRKLIDQLRREVGERNLWVEEDGLGSGEVWNMLTKIEELLGETKTRKGAPPKGVRWDDWKTGEQSNSDDEWEFDNWDKPQGSRV